MKNEVGRTRGGRESRAHGSARRELVNVDKIPSRAKGKRAIVAGEPQAQEEEPQPENEEELEDKIEAGVEEQEDEEDLSDFFDFEEEEEEQDEELEAQPQPPQQKQREKNTRTTQGRNPPRASEARVTSYGGGPTDLSLLPGTSCTTEEGEDMCREYLNFPRTKCRAEFKKMKGAHIRFPMLEKIYTANLRKALKAEKDEESEEVVLGYRECTIRAFLLYLIGGTIFTNKSMQYVDVLFLSYLQDLRLVNTWNWGASGLAYLYHYLEKATHPRCENHGGYNCMFQALIYEHFKRFGAGLVSEKYSHRNPICAKYLPLKGYKYPDEHRTTLDRMEVDEITFRPYEDHRHIRLFEDICWYNGWIMCGSVMICPYLSERVLRQFGHVQSILRHPDESAKAGLNQFTIVEAFADYLADKYVTEEMRGLRAQNGPANLEVMIEEDNAADKQDVFKISRTVIEEVNGKLDGELTLEEAREVLKKVVRDLEPVATYSLPVKRKRDSGEGSKKRKKKKKKKSTEEGLSN
ncbi:hypothetical protein TSUD_178400 [Trifolium subterraneum]|uniref:Aminotransferase-like plant mobile domain-containing protein n=1 Tax=Trifolium subterraneum TaxID=3900 RepID=A0A2Z6LIR8_TRISU|nr:hypothetical protein TSUD_178400 [Trifolium subterraneum]